MFLLDKNLTSAAIQSENQDKDSTIIKVSANDFDCIDPSAFNGYTNVFIVKIDDNNINLLDQNSFASLTSLTELEMLTIEPLPFFFINGTKYFAIKNMDLTFTLKVLSHNSSDVSVTVP